MLSFINRRMFLRKFDQPIVRCASSNESFSLDKTKAKPVPDIVKKPARLPFLKSIFVGQYDHEVLTYPETLNLERYKDLESRVLQIQHSCTEIDKIKQLGLFGMSAPLPSSGLNLSDTEIARIFEHFDYNTFKVVFDHTLCVDIIKTFGTPNQKAKYLSVFASGIICSLHNNTVKATKLPNESWELTGSIKNSTDNFLLFIVENNAFIIEKNDSLIDGEYLKLNKVNVSSEDVLENVVLTKIMHKGKLYTCSLLTTSLKKVFKSTIMSVLPKKRLHMKLREYDSVLKTLSQSLIKIYTIESMIYLTTWMTDGFDDPDIELESAAIQLFIRQTVSTVLLELKMLNGRNSAKEPFSTLCSDVENLIDSLEGSIKLSSIISSRGMEYFNSSDYKENISFFTASYRKIMMKRDNPSLKFDLKQFLHPAFMYSADFLETCVLKFQFIIENSDASGHLDVNNQMLMERLSTIIVHIYAMTAVLGRASRSYCTGIRFSDFEMNIGETVVRESLAILKPLLEELYNGKYIGTDLVYESLADQILASTVNKEQTKT